jgi:hypothetical protein
MEILFYFFGIALLVASVFLMLDTQQNRRINKLAKETKNVPPLFLQRAVDQKLNTLNAFLYEGVVQGNMLPAKIKLNDHTRQSLSAQLSTITDERNSGKLSLQAYNGKLTELLTETRRSKRPSR